MRILSVLFLLPILGSVRALAQEPVGQTGVSGGLSPVNILLAAALLGLGYYLAERRRK